MYFAKDRRTGEIVSAEDAARRRTYDRRYTCPTCGQPVHIRAGAIYSPYFAHAAGLASPECEDYHPGGEYQGGTGGHGRHAPDRPLSLYVVPEGTRRSLQDWHLELLLPRSTDGAGVVYVPDGRSGEIRVFCSQLQGNGKRIPVRLSTAPYRVRPSGDVDSDYARKLLVDTPGFSTTGFSAFRYSESGGRRISEGHPLYWGRGYYLLWHSAFNAHWPATLWREPLRDSVTRDTGSWSLARVELPTEEDAAVREWSESSVGCDVLRPPVTLSLVHPATAAVLEDDSIAVPEAEIILVGVTGERGAATASRLHLESDGAIHDSIRLPERLPVLIQVDRPSSDSTRLILDDEDETELVLRFDEVPEPRAVRSPALLVRRGNRDVAIPAWSVAAEDVLRDVRGGRTVLSQIKLEPLGSVRLRTQDRSTHHWREQHISRDREMHHDVVANAPAVMQDLVFAALQTAIAGKDAFELDLANFGQLGQPADATITDVRPVRRLSSQLRSRIQWLIAAQAGVVHKGVNEPDLRDAVSELITRTGFSRADLELLSLVTEYRRWPAVLIPHVRALASQLRHLTSAA
jgi:hypothetical protein